ncbi:hypothetical protein [uncultured Dialister sp.]|uniref:hypothetical protein n=1 Tax=uncultured Dialister sp. TaxID=278064 RepID=UPI0025CDF19F|nr:hypothetical protein [uncultured Dialister sp.]
MKKWILAIVLGILCLVVPTMASAAEISSDDMIMEFSANKVWIDKGNLCVKGTFYNKRNDLTITKLNDMVLYITLKQKDGTESVVTKKPVKKPMLKIRAGGSKSTTLNLGPFEGTWDSWVVNSDCVFTYINGASW